MQLPRRAIRRPNEPVVPLINIVFLLLVFFLLAGTFQEFEPFEIDPPTSALGTRVEAPERVVLLARNGHIAVAGQPVSLAELTSRFGPGDAATLRADADARARHLLPLLEKLREAGLREVALVTRSPTDP